jgi:hypothetical protein
MAMITKISNNYALSDKRCSQQLHAIANPSDEEVALPSSSITIRLLHQTKHLIKAVMHAKSEENQKVGLPL